MKNIKIWKNTSVLNEFNEGLIFTDNKSIADLILLGSRPIDLHEFPNVQGIFRAGVGKDNVPVSECESKNILIEYPSEETALVLFEETANYTVSLALRMSYPTPNISLPWDKVYRKSLNKKNALIIGLGNIGSRVKNKLETLMQVNTYDVAFNKADELEPLIREANIISLHIPNSSENNNFFDKEKLSWMNEGSILINTARANLVNEDSLYRELEKGRIKAAFDVFWQEPYEGKLNEFYPDRFYMSPHIAGYTDSFLLGCRKALDDLISDLSND